MADICFGDWCRTCLYQNFNYWIPPCSMCMWNYKKQCPSFYHKDDDC